MCTQAQRLHVDDALLQDGRQRLQRCCKQRHLQERDPPTHIQHNFTTSSVCVWMSWENICACTATSHPATSHRLQHRSLLPAARVYSRIYTECLIHRDFHLQLINCDNMKLILLTTLLLSITASSFACSGSKGVRFIFSNNTPYTIRAVQLGPNGENDASRQHMVAAGGQLSVNGNYNALQMNVRAMAMGLFLSTLSHVQAVNMDLTMLLQRQCDGLNDTSVSATHDNWANVAIVAGVTEYGGTQIH